MSVGVKLEVWRAEDETASTANARLATTRATHILWLESTGQLTADTVSQLQDVLARFDLDLLYGDSVMNAGPLQKRIYRPIFSPLRLREQNYLGPVLVMAVAWMKSVGGFDARAEGMHAYDFALRFRGDESRVVCVPNVISIVSAGMEEDDQSRSAVKRELQARDVRARVKQRALGSRRVEYEIEGQPLVSVIIPTRGSGALIRGVHRALITEAVRGLVESTSYDNIEIVVVADDSTPQTVIEDLREIAGERLRLVRFSEPFNFSAKVNRGAMYSRGDYLLLLNDDVEVIEPGWLTNILGLAMQPGVGMSGALLLFEDGTVQHGGQVYRDHWAGHIRPPFGARLSDPISSFAVTREVSGVTAACALISAKTFWEVGGMSTSLPGNFNDVDLCLKVRSTGLSVVFSPDARLFHFESKTRDAAVADEEIGTLRARWGAQLVIDNYWRDPLTEFSRRPSRD